MTGGELITYPIPANIIKTDDNEIKEENITVLLPGYPNNISNCTLDMRPDISMIEQNIPEHITCTHPFRMLKVPLPDNILLVHPSEKQKSGLEKEYFNNPECVFYDSVTSCVKFDYFFFVAHDGVIYRLVFNRYESTVVEYNAVSYPYPFEFYPSRLPETVPRLPVSLKFCDDNYAFLSTGTGWLIIYHTDNRKTSNRWTSIAYLFLPENCDTFVLHQDTNGLEELTFGHPFYVSDVQITSAKIFDIVVSCVSIHKPCNGLPKPSVLLKRSTAHWIRLMIGDTHISRFGYHKIIDVNGSIKGITIDADHKGLIIASSSLPVVVYDSQGQQNRDKCVRLINNKIPIPKRYQWKDNEDKIVITFDMNAVICADDLFVEFTSNFLNVSHRWEKWLCGELLYEIIPSDSSWNFERNLERPASSKLEIVLKKKERKPWNNLILTNKNGFKVRETKDKDKEAYCIETEELVVSWLESDFVLHSAHLKKGKFLFNSEHFPNVPKKFAVEYGDNCVLYGFDSNPYPYKHEYTFEKFMPIYHSIKDKKYTLFNQKDQNMIIISGDGKIYAYYKRIPNTASYKNELLKSANPQKTCVLRIVDYGNLCGNPEIVGAIATEKIIYLFSIDCMYVIAI